MIPLIIFLSSLPFFAQRDPVLGQIDLPHSYYYREMYLPQLTTGPSSVAWSPDAKEVVYSMAGSLWRQRLDSGTAVQLTAGPGYDYQPDWSRDGRWIVYASYDKDAIELHALDLQSGQSKQLTSGGNVNVEPRFSPDSKRIAFVSTSYNGRFHIFAGDFNDGTLSNVQRLTGETRSSLPRYYYSQFDTEISPTWSPDGSELVFISNRGHIYGSGGFWRMKAQPGAEAREIYYEETTWKARPDWSPDGTRLVYSSYLGRQWNQLWVIPAGGGDAFPLSYGEYDNTAPRWSPDGQHIAFISNRGGNTSLWIQDAFGGAQRRLEVKQRRYLKPMGTLRITVLDRSGKPTPARVFVIGPDQRAYAPDDAWMHADDSYDPTQQAFEAHYFHTLGESELTVPDGLLLVDVMKGLSHAVEHKTLTISANQRSDIIVKLRPVGSEGRQIYHVGGGSTGGTAQGSGTKDFFDWHAHWVNADLHVHMNYAGAYRNTPQHLVEQGEAEGLDIIEDLVVNKEVRIPDISYFRVGPDPASKPDMLLMQSQEFHTSYWGHLGLLNLQHNFVLPGYAAYPNTPAASLYPTNADIADLAHAQGALVGYVHPFDSFPNPANPAPLTDELPVDVALGKVDYMEILGFSDHKSTAAVWYKLLNCGFHIPAGAGTDAMANFASLRGPVGLNRVYALVPPGPIDIHQFLNSLREGHTFATNGPLLNFSLGGQPIGGELKLPAGTNQVNFSLTLRSIVPLDHVQIICNGKVIADMQETWGAVGTITISKSGWCILRAWNEKAELPVLDLYPYATTSPIYITVGGEPTRSPEDAAYFVAWIDRLSQAASSYPDWRSAAEKEHVQKLLSDARAIYEQQTK
ncbi:MAG TPA: CehA/McbA family metallohydrolase [Terriglobales bacterium]|nr:CehA/McbA family metallohydrolase [Terriglobales bacterium]